MDNTSVPIRSHGSPSRHNARKPARLRVYASHIQPSYLAMKLPHGQGPIGVAEIRDRRLDVNVARQPVAPPVPLQIHRHHAVALLDEQDRWFRGVLGWECGCKSIDQ